MTGSPPPADELSPRAAFTRWLELEFWKPIIDDAQNYHWEDSDQWGDRDLEHFWPFVRRVAIIRQFEGLAAINNLIEAESGHFAGLLLRPAFEELVWIEYLQRHSEIANRMVVALLKHEIGTSVLAQLKYAGPEETLKAGFTPDALRGYVGNHIEAESTLKELGKLLGWKSSRLLPSMAYLSKEVGREDQYRFLYHGTSRYVHFSTHEMAHAAYGVNRVK